MMRLQKYLAACGVAPRREAEGFIASGRVAVNGVPAHVGDSVDPERDVVFFDGRPMRLDEKVYVVLNKPRGVVSTAKDTHSRKTVLDCLTGVGARVFPVGRLDMDVEGVLLLTNDGELAHRIMHPSYEVEKLYMAWVTGKVTPETVARIEKGVELEDGKTSPAKTTILEADEGASLIRLTLHEGHKREVKRLCAAVGHPVRALRRIAVGGVRANGLRPGEWRYLSAHEIGFLRKLTGLS